MRYNNMRYRVRYYINRLRRLRTIALRRMNRFRLVQKRFELLSGKYPQFYWPTTHIFVTQAFGINPRDYNKFGLPGHEGIDLRAPLISEICSVWWGTVKLVGEGVAYGNQVRILHTIKGVEYESIYAHFAEPSHLKIGDKVTRGQVIGLADSTGNSTGSHLHLGLKQYTGDKPDTAMQKKYNWPKNIVDPTPFFKELSGYE